MSGYRVRVVVKEVRGSCALGYKPGDEFIIENYYIPKDQKANICIHALIGMSSLLIPFLKGIPAKELGIGESEDIGYVQCPDPGSPHTKGGTVVFELKREKIN